MRPTTRFRARLRHESGAMNKTEARYGAYLEARRSAGEIVSHRFEHFKLRLAKATFLTPDFAVVLPDGTLEMHEVKGFWEEDARVKIKVAAEQYPEFVWIGVRWDKADGWQYETFGK